MTSSAVMLQKELKDLAKNQPSFYIELEDGNIYLWNVGLYISNVDSKYDGAFLRAQIRFPSNYPFSPPTFRFTPAIFHPNVYGDGRVCISILHEAGNLYSDEPSDENWSPAQCVESVLVSIISILDDPNINSPANVDASKMFRDNKDAYYERVSHDVSESKKHIPEDFHVPDPNEVKGDDYEDDWFYDDEEEEDEDEEDDEDDDDHSFYDGEDVEMSEDYGEVDDSKHRCEQSRPSTCI